MILRFRQWCNDVRSLQNGDRLFVLFPSRPLTILVARKRGCSQLREVAVSEPRPITGLLLMVEKWWHSLISRLVMPSSEQLDEVLKALFTKTGMKSDRD